jgi:hypothetical protein
VARSGSENGFNRQHHIFTSDPQVHYGRLLYGRQ